MRRTSCTEVVTPGVLPTLTTRVRFRLLIRDDLPTLGSPMIPGSQLMTDDRPSKRMGQSFTGATHPETQSLHLLSILLNAL